MPIELPENVVLAKPFTAFALIKADGATEENGVKWLRGPIAPEEADIEGDVLTKAGLETGLETFLFYGGGETGHVDWSHMYQKTKSPKYLIAKGHPYTGPDGRPWLADELLDKPLAREAWDHVRVGGRAGHSLEGLCKASERDSKNRRLILKTEIHMVTIDPQPKGKQNFLEVGPPQSMQRIAKGYMAELDRGDLADAGWVPMPVHLDPDLYGAYFQDTDYAERLMKSIAHVKKLYAVGTDLSKALTTGSDIVTDGATGGQTLRRQHLAGKVTCSCGAQNDARRPKCKSCKRPLEMKKAKEDSMAAVVARERERPMREDARRPSRDKEDGGEDEDEDYDPRTDPDHADYDPDYSPDGGGGNDDGGDEPMTNEEAGEMKKSLALALREIQELKKALNPPAEPDPADYVSETYTTEALFKGIGAEFGLALAPIVARLEALEEGNETLQKALDQATILLDESADRGEAIQKALAATSPEQLTKALAAKETETAKHTPAEGETAPTGAVTTDDILSKGSDNEGLSSEEGAEVQELLVKAQRLARDFSIQADGYEDAVDAMNEGRFNRQTYQALRKGVEVASGNAERLLKA